jgi:hypothetical protein
LRRSPGVALRFGRARCAASEKIRDEVLDVRGLNFSNRTIAEMLEERLQPVVDRAGECEVVSDDMALLVQGGELAERQRAGLRRRLQAAVIEGASP